MNKYGKIQQAKIEEQTLGRTINAKTKRENENGKKTGKDKYWKSNSAVKLPQYIGQISNSRCFC